MLSNLLFKMPQVCQRVRCNLHLLITNDHLLTSDASTAILMIVLDDINDNPPHFTPSSYYTARVSEAAKPGTEVVRVVAVDYDKNPGPIQYLMVYDTNASLAFEITDHNRQTGIVTLSRPVDYEETAWINITIIANDMGSPSLTSQAWVYVEIEDVNDNSPEWTVCFIYSHLLSLLSMVTIFFPVGLYISS